MLKKKTIEKPRKRPSSARVSAAVKRRTVSKRTSGTKTHVPDAQLPVPLPVIRHHDVGQHSVWHPKPKKHTLSLMLMLLATSLAIGISGVSFAWTQAAWGEMQSSWMDKEAELHNKMADVENIVAQYNIDRAKESRGAKELDALCASYGPSWSAFDVNDIGLSFCRDASWGKPSYAASGIKPERRTGEQWSMGFASEPVMFIQTKDFGFIGQTDPYAFDWKALRLDADADALPGELGLEEGSKVQYVDVSGHKGVKVTRMRMKGFGDAELKTVYWYVPNVLGDAGYNLIIGGLQEKEQDWERLVSSLRF